MYVQAIPIFLRSDDKAFKYINDNVGELNAITGDALQLILPKEVEAGDAAGIADLFSIRAGTPRYPGLLRSDLPCFWIEDGAQNHAILRIPSDTDQIGRQVRAMTDAAQQGKNAKEVKSWVQQTIASDLSERDSAFSAISAILRPFLSELPMSKSTEKLLAFAFGCIFVIALLALAIVYPTPTTFQYNIFRVVLALAAAGAISMTPGFLDVTISTFIRAGGALAVFVIVYFYNPASLVADSAAVAPPANPPAKSTK
jgi:hypothetical protein